MYVPEEDRPMVSKLPELSSPIKELSSTDGAVLPDEVFRMEMQTAGKLELSNPFKEAAPDEEIDLVTDEDSACEGDEDDADEEELDCVDKVSTLASPNNTLRDVLGGKNILFKLHLHYTLLSSTLSLIFSL
ncbi:unnamed protein product [Strongylus vulgaris]|uniref:Uncharacterized protein n=1 Tax=Strongylus vulgaris TaxID=40348 RepID=A0A3P7I385_STRVU|nr:unnamed protein product [Strongylus vulgaris]